MSFSHPRGTRGGRPPHGRIVRGVNKIAMSRIRRTGGTFMGMDTLVLTTVGRKSGQQRSTPVGWFRGPNDSWIIVASAAGARANPAWYLNLAAHPDQATIEVGGQSIPVSGRELHGTERDRAWASITTAVPRFTQYERKTDREMPVIELTRRS